MSGDYARWLAAETAAALKHDRHETTATQPCPDCGGKGCVEGDGCNCDGYCEPYYMHKPYCGLEPCPRGCPFVAVAMITVPVACPVCRDTGVVISADHDGSPYETDCPERVHDDARDIGARRAAELFAASDDPNWPGI